MNTKPKFVLICEHDNAKVRYFGPYESTNDAEVVANQFSYENTPYHLCIVELISPTQQTIVDIKKQDNNI